MSCLLVLRPEPGAAATAARASALGHACVVAPLFAIHALDWEPPDPLGFDAVMMTSATAARLGGAGLARFAALPLYAVGAATADAAMAAGFAHVVAGDADAEALLARVGADGIGRLLHLTGREHHAVARPGILVERRIVYASEAVDALSCPARDALAGGAVALLHSPRAAALLARLVREHDMVRIACLSRAVAEAAGSGWRAVAVARAPTDDALLAAAAGVCDHAAR